MITVSDAEFREMVAKAIDALAEQMEHVRNVAIVVEDEPTEQQREQLKLRGNESLFGLYEGIPLSERGGGTKLIPDKITLYRMPLSQYASDKRELQQEIHHTLWHELGHYYGLDHEDIREREQ